MNIEISITAESVAIALFRNLPCNLSPLCYPRLVATKLMCRMTSQFVVSEPLTLRMDIHHRGAAMSEKSWTHGLIAASQDLSPLMLVMVEQHL